MSVRKPLPKKLRFEVFKRDHFTCQYCGRMAPDVILEVDHIEPVAEGGKDDILNLITSCRDCNRGKGKVRISANDAVKKQQEQLVDLAEKKEQIEMLAEWKTELLRFKKAQAEKINAYLGEATGYRCNERGMAIVDKLLDQFLFQEIMTAIDIAVLQYFDGTEKSWENMFYKIGGICYNRRKRGL